MSVIDDLADLILVSKDQEKKEEVPTATGKFMDTDDQIPVLSAIVEDGKIVRLSYPDGRWWLWYLGPRKAEHDPLRNESEADMLAEAYVRNRTVDGPKVLLKGAAALMVNPEKCRSYPYSSLISEQNGGLGYAPELEV